MKLRAERLPLRTRNQFIISRTRYKEHVNVLVTIEHEGFVGLGEAAPNAFYGESADSALVALAKMEAALPISGAWNVEEVGDELQKEFPADAAARAGVSAALYDLLGKQLSVPVYRMLGLDPERAPLSSFTIPLCAPEELEPRVRDAAEYPILKVKLGSGQDEAILRTVRAAAPGKRLFVDANGGWSREEAVRMAALLPSFDVELLEQPVARQDIEGLAYVRARSPIPVYADESCAVAADIPRLAGAVDGVCIKLAKCGGLGEALRLVRTARTHDLRVMAGCMIESSLGISAIAQLAPLLDHADLDGAALLAEDPFSGVRMERGRLVYPQTPGLGVMRTEGARPEIRAAV